jgi:ketosteroid isomerase-like protein
VSLAKENKAVVRRLLEQLAKGNLGVIDELLAPNFVDRSLMPRQDPTREDFKRSMVEILEGYATTAFTIEEQVAEGDTFGTSFRESGVQRGEERSPGNFLLEELHTFTGEGREQEDDITLLTLRPSPTRS